MTQQNASIELIQPIVNKDFTVGDINVVISDNTELRGRDCMGYCRAFNVKCNRVHDHHVRTMRGGNTVGTYQTGYYCNSCVVDALYLNGWDDHNFIKGNRDGLAYVNAAPGANF